MNNDTFTKCTCPDLQAINAALADALKQIAWKLERKECIDGETCTWAKIDRNDAVIDIARAALALNSHKG